MLIPDIAGLVPDLENPVPAITQAPSQHYSYKTYCTLRRFGARYPGAARFFEVDLPHASAKKQELVQQLLQCINYLHYKHRA
jgi:ABC-type uncharacterized transport system involved in gliding motility auxiliary subunit